MMVEQLKEIISSVNLQTISKALKENGFTLAYPNLIWEYQDLFSSDKNIIKNVHYKAVDTNSCCRAKMYQDIERYGEIIFIEVSLSESGQKKTLFYSNLPVNEEYEQDKKEQCFKCKKGYGKKSLIEYCGEWVCPECLYSILLKEIRINNL